jgi:uncharacterized protein YndB with AHSA1/START domain
MNAHVVKDLIAKSIVVSREFDAPLESVWRAYTEKELLDQWWAPLPWRAETKSMNFAVGGYWLYAMVSPESERHWGRMNYLSIQPFKRFDVQDAFCDENGNVNPTLPISYGKNVFTRTRNGVLVEFTLTYETEADLQKVIEMGFEQGITACLEQLEKLLAKI